MFNQVNEPTNYMTYDPSSLNPYNYKNLNDRFSGYQNYQDMYYFTRQINPISLVPLHPESLDPSNRPCNIRTMIYAQGDANNNELLNLQRTPENNPNLWRDQHPAQKGYHTQYESTLNYTRPISLIQAGHNSSVIDYHGFYDYR